MRVRFMFILDIGSEAKPIPDETFTGKRWTVFADVEAESVDNAKGLLDVHGAPRGNVFIINGPWLMRPNTTAGALSVLHFYAWEHAPFKHPSYLSSVIENANIRHRNNHVIRNGREDREEIVYALPDETP